MGQQETSLFEIIQHKMILFSVAMNFGVEQKMEDDLVQEVCFYSAMKNAFLEAKATFQRKTKGHRPRQR